MQPVLSKKLGHNTKEANIISCTVQRSMSYWNFLRYLFIVTVITSLFMGCTAQESWKLIWSDEFSGTIVDTTKWNFQIGNGLPDLPGWGNNELEYYKKENCTVKDGLLLITAKKENCSGFKYTSGRMRTKGKGDWKYGKVEARMKLPIGRGIWSAFWMMPTNDVYGGWPQSGEIDIMEMIGHDTQTVYGTIHYGHKWPNNKHIGNSFKSSSDLTQGFHVYSVEWEPEKISWFVDGKCFFNVMRSEIINEIWPFDERFHLIINCAVGGNWPGNPDASTTFPQVLAVDWIRVYQK